MEKAELMEARRIQYEIESTQERIERLRSMMEKTTPTLSLTGGVSGTPANDKLDKQMAKLLELERELIEKTILLNERYKNIEEWIDTLPGIQGAIMRMRYIDCMPWAKIADRTGYSEVACYKMHQRAFRAKIIDKYS